MKAENMVQFDAKIMNYAALSRPLLQSVLVLHHGEILSEHYWRGFSATSYQPVYSITKSVVSTLVGMAIADGKLSLDDTMAQLFPEMGFIAGKHAASVTVRHLLTMTAGFQKFGGRMVSSNPIELLLKRARAAEPGEQFHYNNEDVDLLVAVLERALGEAAIDYAQRRLFLPLGIWKGVTKSERKRLWKTDNQSRIKGSHGLHLTSHEMVSFAQLYLQGGRWQDKQLLPEKFVAASTTAQVSGGYPECVKYGYLWWVSVDREERHAFFASGAGGQYIYVLPALDLVIVITSTLARTDGRPHRVMIVRFVTDLIGDSST